MQQIDLTSLQDAKASGKFTRIGSVATLNNHLNQIYNLLGSQIKDYVVFFRGHADSDFIVEPSIYRANPITGASFITKEEELCTGIIRECPSEFPESMTAFEMLVKMQHYELPTRLLDITENPLVALYFAALEPLVKSHDGQILVYFVHKSDIVNFNNLQVGALSSISFLPANLLKAATTTQALKDLFHNMRLYTTYLPRINSLNDLNKTLCVLPKKSNPRITRQQGAFFLFGIQNGDKSQLSNLSLTPFIMDVANDSRSKILDHLARYSISEKFLFPEIDNVAHYLKTH